MTIEFHSIDLAADSLTNVMTVRVTGKLTKQDYAAFVPEVEKWVNEHGKVRILFDMHDFHGWKLSAAWEDFKFGLKHFRDIERIAMVGEKTWEHGMAVFCKPFTLAKVRYFDRSDAEQAREWLVSD